MPNDVPTSQPAPDNQHIEELISQLSPQELELLATALSSDMQNPSGGDGSVANLAQAIEAHLANTPEAALPEASTEEAAALQFIKSASYIEGFINHAVSSGLGLKEAVDIYDYSLVDTLTRFKTAEESEEHEEAESSSEEKKEHKRKSQKAHEKSETYKQEQQEHMNDNKIEEIKLAAYYEGVFERAKEYGFSDHQTMNLLKAAEGEEDLSAIPHDSFEDVKRFLAGDQLANAVGEESGSYTPGDAPYGVSAQRVSPGILGQLKNYLSAGGNKLQEGLASAKGYTQGLPANQLRNAGIAAGGLGALGLGAYAAHKANKNKEESEKYASFRAGAIKQGSAYGLTPQQTLSILKAADFNLDEASTGVPAGSEFPAGMLEDEAARGFGAGERFVPQADAVSMLDKARQAMATRAAMGEEPGGADASILEKLLGLKDNAAASMSKATDSAQSFANDHQNALRNAGIGALGLAGGGALGYAAANKKK